jgi:hypothetical protein
MAMELMAEVAAAGWPGMSVIDVRQIRLLRGIVVGWEGQTVRVVARPRSEGLARGERLESTLMLDLAITSVEDPGRVHYQALVGLASEANGAQAPETLENSNSAGVLEGAGPLPMGIKEAYRDWLFHGPLFQGIVQVEAIGPRGARAILRPSSPRDCLHGNPPGEWLIDPVVIDSAFQMMILWARLHWDMTLLPAAIRAYRRFGPLSGERHGAETTVGSSSSERPWGDRLKDVHLTSGIRYELRIRPENQVPSNRVDHCFFGLDRRILGFITDMEATGSKALNRLAAGRRG